ncbi:MAG: hypothetical protein ACXWCM_01550 [Acidimicrobiales bacterium]
MTSGPLNGDPHDILDFELDPSEIDRINALDTGIRGVTSHTVTAASAWP